VIAPYPAKAGTDEPPPIPDPQARSARKVNVATAAALAAAAALRSSSSPWRSGRAALNVDFPPRTAVRRGGGGIKNAIGTLIITGSPQRSHFAGVLLAILTRSAPRRLAEAIGLTLNVLAGVPTR
jgi:hypothetical protein